MSAFAALTGSHDMTIWAMLGLGFMLGLRHATDADHVVAVSTIVSRSKTLRGAVFVGMLWGLGHTLTILLVGGTIVVFDLVVPPYVETVLEACVAAMLVTLGAINVYAAFAPRRDSTLADARLPERAGPSLSLRPLFVGIVHGLAGSAAIALLSSRTPHPSSCGRWQLAPFVQLGWLPRVPPAFSRSS